MLILALDTCDSRGSVALLRDREAVAVIRHEGEEDYSGWLLPAVQGVLRNAGLAKAGEVDLLSVAAGPGSFTGLRVGLTTVKAWAEVYGKPIVAVSRLEAVAVTAGGEKPWVAAFVNAHREQVFGALYRREGQILQQEGDEVVERPDEFVARVDERAGNEAMEWASLDPEVVADASGWRLGKARRSPITRVEPELAVAIGQLGWEKAQRGETTDALRLDANYVRRSDAEIFWKGSAAHAK